MKLLLVACAVATYFNSASACKAFNEGPWAKEHKPNWKAESMAPWCLNKLNSYPYLMSQRQFTGYFVKVPGNAPANYQKELDSIVMFKWHCLKTCVDDYGSQVQYPLNIGQGTPFQDSPDPNLVTLSCTCMSGVKTPTMTMLELDAKWMAECHSSATTTVLTTASTEAPTTTVETFVIDTLKPLECYLHDQGIGSLALPKMPEFAAGYMVVQPNSPRICAERCYAVNTEYIFAGVTEGNQCWCGTNAAASGLGWWSKYKGVNSEFNCNKFIDNYPQGSGLPCMDATGMPAFTDWATDRSPKPGWDYCGGRKVMHAFKLNLKTE